MKQKIGKIVLVLGSLLLCFLIMEFAVRILDLPPRPLAQLPINSYRLSENPVIGYEFRPGYKPTEDPFDSSHKGYSINSDGFRDYEYKQIKSEKTKRIIAIGDSTTAGNGIPDLNNTYTKQLEILLNKDNNNDIHYEVLNMGVGGYHTMQEIETLKVKGLKYDPDIVFVTFCLNDFSIQSDGGVHRALSRKNYLSYQGSEHFGYFLRTSRLAFILYHRLKSQKSEHVKWYTENVLKNKTTVEAGLNLLSQLQQKHDFTVFVLILPRFTDPFQEYKSIDIHKKVFQAAEGLPGITVIDLLNDFKNVNHDAEKFSNDGIHMNEYGHKTMAEILLPIIKH